MSYNDPYSSAGTRSLSSIKKEKTDYIIQKVIQALNILEQFHGEVDELSSNELCKRLSMNESSVDMLLATLRSRNYIEKNSLTDNYRLGFKNLELAQTVLRQMDLYRVSHPVLASITEQCGETAAVAVLSKSHVIELDACQSEHPVQVVSRVGVHLPVHCTAAGKALIAYKSPDELEFLLQGVELDGFTGNTITCATELKLNLSRIVETGFATDDEERDRDVRGVAAVIHDYAGLVVGAVVITGPSCRISQERLFGEMAALVQDGARDISARLGFHVAAAGSDGAVVVAKTAPSAPKKTRVRLRQAEK